MLNAIGSKADLESEDSSYHYLVADLLDSEVVQEMKNYVHHGNTSCFQHCLNVSYYNYKLCKLFSLNERAGARAGLLHDLFLYDWHCYVPEKGERLHGFTHAKRALENARKSFYISDLEADIIEKHMFPLNLFSLPRYRETLVIVFTDKLCGIMETVSYRGCVIKKFLKRKFGTVKGDA
ncbi:MAG: HD family phosphohydrolase [Oscillospiraceae bacterium]|nr:HD family phosphohydrolase [Oscillospiraceae bacterium]